MGLNPQKLTSGHKVEPEQGSNPALQGWLSHPDWSCLTFLKLIMVFRPWLKLTTGQKNRFWTWTRFELITFWLVLSDLSKNHTWPSGLESQIDLWSKINFEPEQGSNSRVIFSSWLVLSDLSKNNDSAFRPWIPNWPLVTNLDLNKVRTHYPRGEFLILIGPVWPFKKSIQPIHGMISINFWFAFFTTINSKNYCKCPFFIFY